MNSPKLDQLPNDIIHYIATLLPDNRSFVLLFLINKRINGILHQRLKRIPNTHIYQYMHHQSPVLLLYSTGIVDYYTELRLTSLYNYFRHHDRDRVMRIINDLENVPEPTARLFLEKYWTNFNIYAKFMILIKLMEQGINVIEYVREIELAMYMRGSWNGTFREFPSYCLYHSMLGGCVDNYMYMLRKAEFIPYREAYWHHVLCSLIYAQRYKMLHCVLYTTPQCHVICLAELLDYCYQINDEQSFIWLVQIHYHSALKPTVTEQMRFYASCYRNSWPEISKYVKTHILM